MSEATPPPAPEETPVRVPKRRAISRWTRRALALVAAAVAAGLVLTFTIDLGRFSGVRSAAEKYSTEYLQRDVHIGRVGISLWPGIFTVDDVVIDGKHPGDKPFFRAGRVYVHMPLWALFTRGGNLQVQMWLTDWQMTVENWPDGNSQPRLGGPPRTSSGRPLWFKTTATVYASGGEFVYDDHMLPWSVRAPNLSFALVRAENLSQYVGVASFTKGSVKFQGYRAMQTDLTTRFVLEGRLVRLQHIDLITDGSVSHVNGTTDFGNWPEQTYNVNSTVDFATMREIYFPNEPWRIQGTGQFTGIFHFPKAGGRLLSGNFTSEDVMVNDLRFRTLHGALDWRPERFVIPHAEAELLDGTTRFTYGAAPLGKPGGSTMTFAADYLNLDLAGVNRLMNLKSLELSGTADGSMSITWPSGQFASGRRGHGHTLVRQVAGAAMASATLPATPRPILPEPKPFVSTRPTLPLAIAADVEYTLDADGWTFEDSWAATPFTYVSFSGRLAKSSEFPFHVTSHDWQESDRVLTRIMSAVSGPVGAIEVGGRGTFDGVMTGSFSAPRIAGHIAGDGTRVWDVTWGRAQADVVIEGGYVDVANSRFGDRADSFIVADGHYSLGFRRDDKEEIRARVALTNWPMADLRHAFALDDWPVDGVLGQANLVLTGRYKNMFGTGRMRIDNGVAWREHFDTASGDLDLEGTGIRIHRIEMQKGVGRMRGDARIGWDGTYVFESDGIGIPVQELDNFKFEKQPLSGQLTFKASGAGKFDDPVYVFSGSIADLFVGTQGVGRVQGQIRVQRQTMFIERLEASSGLLDLAGRGTIALNERYDSALNFRFTQSSIDPYLTFFAPKLSPYTRAILSGSVDVKGPLGAAQDIAVNANIDDATLTLLDYELRNDGPVQLSYENQAFTVRSLRLVGSDTRLELKGGADVDERIWNLSAAGNASLSILQLVFKTVRTSGAATLNASLTGSFDTPRLTGSATVADGRLRPFGSIHSLEAVNGRVTFDDSGINLGSAGAVGSEGPGLKGRIGGGEVTFGGNIAMRGYELSDYNLTVTGRSMGLRYPEGFRSTANMDLQLVGPLALPRLVGTIDVLRVQYVSTGDTNILGLAGVGTTGVGLSAPASVPVPAPSGGPVAGQGTPVALDIRVTVPRTYLVNTNTDRIEAMADFHLGGNFDRPAFTGSLDILAGEFQFNGNRYFVRESSIDFTNPDRTEPVFDLVAETRPRVNQQTYNITIAANGPMNQLRLRADSDPWLPQEDIVALLLGGQPNVDTAERRALRSPQESQERAIQSAVATILAAPVSSRVESVVERLSGLDTVQITPRLAGEVAFQQLNPTARITLGQRIGPRVFLTYSRTVGISAAQDEIILLEYDQNDRVSWVLSRNENRTFALDFRIRYTH